MNHRALASFVLLFSAGLETEAGQVPSEPPKSAVKGPAAKTSPDAADRSYLSVRSVLPEKMTKDDGGKPKSLVNYGLKYADFDRVMAVPVVAQAIPVREIWETFRRQVVGTTNDYAGASALVVARGRFLTAADSERFSNVAVLGSEVAATLFDSEDPIGEAVKLGSDYYTVIGVAKERPETSGVIGRLRPQHFNSDIYIPLNTCKLRFGERIISSRRGAMEFEETQLTRIIIRLSDDASKDAITRIKAAIEPFHPKADVAFDLQKASAGSR